MIKSIKTIKKIFKEKIKMRIMIIKIKMRIMIIKIKMRIMVKIIFNIMM